MFTNWTYPRKIKLEAIIWRDILKGTLLFHDNQIKKVTKVECVIEPNGPRDTVMNLTFHDGTTLHRRWKGDNVRYAIFIKVSTTWNIFNWSTP